MGLILPGAGVASSGKVGGVVYSKNRYGAYARTRVVGTNPSTSRQTTIRTLFGNVSKAWRSTLTGVQRTAWTAYSNGTNWMNRLGGAIVLSGNAAYVACNTLRLQLGLARIDTAPTQTGFATLTVPGTVTLFSGGSVVLSGFNAADQWQALGGGLGVFVGSKVSSAAVFFKGPYKLAGLVTGGTATLTGGTVTGITGLLAGEFRGLRLAGTDSQGRLTGVIELAPAAVSA